MRFRHTFITLGGLLVTLCWFLTDPDVGIVQSLTVGASTIATILILLKTVLYVGMLHISRRALIDYIDLKVYFIKALESSTGAGLATIAIAMIMLSISLVILATVL